MQAQAECRHQETRWVPAWGSEADFHGPPPPGHDGPAAFERRWFLLVVCAGCRRVEGVCIDDFDTLEEAQARAAILEAEETVDAHAHQLHGPEEHCAWCRPTDGYCACGYCAGPPLDDDEEGGDDADD